MVEAMEWAADFAERSKVFEAPKNDRGYVKDGWTSPSPAERAQVIMDLAATVVERPAKVESPVSLLAICNLYDEHRAIVTRDGRDQVHPNFIKELKELFDGREG